MRSKPKYPGESDNDVFAQLIDGLFGRAASAQSAFSLAAWSIRFLTAVEFVEVPGVRQAIPRWRVRVASLAPAGIRDVLRGFRRARGDHFACRPASRIQGPEAWLSPCSRRCRRDPKRLLRATNWSSSRLAGGDLRIICDYVAAMTDTHLLKTYERLLFPAHGIGVPPPSKAVGSPAASYPLTLQNVEFGKMQGYGG